MDMGTPAGAGAAVAGRRPPRLHRAWLVAGVTFLVLLASAAFRSSLGVLLVLAVGAVVVGVVVA